MNEYKKDLIHRLEVNIRDHRFRLSQLDRELQVAKSMPEYTINNFKCQKRIIALRKIHKNIRHCYNAISNYSDQINALK